MNLYLNNLYQEDLRYINNLNLDWSLLTNKVVLITGGTGAIGSLLVDTLMFKNEHDHLNCTVIVVGRTKKRAMDRFVSFDSPYFKFLEHDVNNPLPEVGNVDYIIHAASNTHPVSYAAEPVATITTNVFGTYNLLEYGVAHHMKRFLLLSTVEIYGENRGDVLQFDENYMGYIDANTLRAGYPESKRVAEALCQAYIKEHNIEAVIARLSRVYGPTLLKSDTKALSQFINKALSEEDIVLKSAGTQFYSYCYVADAVAGLFTTLLSGKNGEAYNVSSDDSDITLKDVASYLASLAGKKVVFDLPKQDEALGYSKATTATLDNSKLKTLGWSSHYNIKDGLKRTIKTLKSLA